MKLNEIEKIKYNQYVQGKITLKELLKWHDEYLKKLVVNK